MLGKHHALHAVAFSTTFHAALALRNEVKIEDIESIQVCAYKLAVAGHDYTEIVSVSSAKMSIPFSVAVALVKGEAGLEAFTEDTINDATILALTKKVEVVEDESLTALAPAKRSSILKIRTKTATAIKQVDYPMGEPENPLSRKELEDKFRTLARYGGLTEENIEEIIKELWKDDCSINRILQLSLTDEQ